MKERYDLSALLKELEEEEGQPKELNKTDKVSQDDIKRLFSIKKLSKENDK